MGNQAVMPGRNSAAHIGGLHGTRYFKQDNDLGFGGKVIG